MPKLNVQQTNKNVIQAFKNALAIGNLKGIIASDGNHNFSTAGSNRNLLDNPWFTVNQRSFTTGSVTAPIDRWRVGGTTTVTWSANGMSIVTTQADQGLYQRVPKGVLFAGETYTLTLLTQEGELYSATITMPSSGHLSGKINGGADDLRYYIAVTSNYDEVWMYRHTAGTLNIKAEKVEKGSVSTLANDAPPEYGEELAKCRLYFERIQSTGKAMTLGFGYPDGYHTLYASFKINPKRAGLSSVSVSPSLLVGQGSTSSASNVSVYHSIPNGQVTLVITAANAFQTQGVLYRCLIPAGGYIDFFADL